MLVELNYGLQIGVIIPLCMDYYDIMLMTMYFTVETIYLYENSHFDCKYGTKVTSLKFPLTDILLANLK